MPNPFPGMDPYIERNEIWADFHSALIDAIRGLVQPLLRPRYAALTQDRLYAVESEQPIRPEIGVVRTSTAAPAVTPAAVAEPDAPAIFEIWREEIREPLIQIVEPAAGNRVVTAIEVLSPDNKRHGPGRDAYLTKREELWSSGTNLVEIDLLREGDPTVRLSTEKLASLGRWHYLVAVTRRHPSLQEVYAIPLERRLPRVAIPLAAGDKDVSLDLQGALQRCWDEGPYPEVLRYAENPRGFTPQEVQWCRELLTKAGIRSACQTQGEPRPINNSRASSDE